MDISWKRKQETHSTASGDVHIPFGDSTGYQDPTVSSMIMIKWNLGYVFSGSVGNPIPPQSPGFPAATRFRKLI